MIAYVDAPPKVEPQAGSFLFTAMSGGEMIQLLLTPHALTGMEARIRKAQAESWLRAMEADEAVTTFPSKGRQRAR